MKDNIVLPNGLILTCYRMDVSAVLIKVWGTSRPFFKAEITYGGDGLGIIVSTPVASVNSVFTIKEAVEWLSEQWERHKAKPAQSEHELISQHQSFVHQWETLSAHNPPTQG